MTTRIFARVVLAALLMAAFLFAPAVCTRANAEAQEGKSSAQKPAESHEGEDPLNPVTLRGMNFPGDLTVWTAVVFLVVLVILKRYAWGPITKGLENREQGIASMIAQAQQKHEEALQRLADYEKKLAASRDEVRAILEKGRADAERLGQELINKAKEESAAERQRSLQQIDAATTAAIVELANRSASLAVDLAGKIVGARLNAQDHNRLIQDAVTSFTSKGSSSRN